MTYEKILTIRSYVGLRRSEKEKSVIPHWSLGQTWDNSKIATGTYFSKQLSQRSIEAHEISSICWDHFHVSTADIFGCSAHGRLDGLPCRVHEYFSEGLKDFLYLLRIGFLKVLDCERVAEFVDASQDIAIELFTIVSGLRGLLLISGGSAYKSKEEFTVALLLLASATVVTIGLRPELVTHSCVGVHVCY